jgi:hypothetical protein
MYHDIQFKPLCICLEFPVEILYRNIMENDETMDNEF